MRASGTANGGTRSTHFDHKVQGRNRSEYTLITYKGGFSQASAAPSRRARRYLSKVRAAAPEEGLAIRGHKRAADLQLLVISEEHEFIDGTRRRGRRGGGAGEKTRS
ncbi:hypothetical protein EVAR_15748_1 [Eumeta japonica]|uniref:Uncharacterized protein n=1 Tax=Eumeta variegata TaxID=151549 RepID=A0A4C1Z5B0_EUMVA|nr:hypothetical protein EVAR_15748_1 [Eumeta japonica]